MVCLTFNNKLKIKFNTKSLPIGCNEAQELSNRWVVYRIDINGKVYIGSTGDFGERMNTHLKDARSKKDDLHSDMNKYKECVVSVIEVYDTEKSAREREKEEIKKYAKSAISILGKRRFLYEQSYLNNLIKTKLYNIIK